jgi:hypothetical protein
MVCMPKETDGHFGSTLQAAELAAGQMMQVGH